MEEEEEEEKIELMMNMWHIVYFRGIIHSLLLFNMYAFHQTIHICESASLGLLYLFQC